MSEEKVKILLLGPSRSGKSTIADFLAGTRDTPTKEYHETRPLRILEVELGLENLRLNTNTNNNNTHRHYTTAPRRAIVQLWDVSGNTAHQACWPAVAANADGIIYVFNPAVRGAERELLLWYKHFAVDQQEGEGEGEGGRQHQRHALVFAHHSTPPEAAAGDGGVPALPKPLRGTQALETSLDYQSENFKEAFDALVERIITSRVTAEEEALLQRERESSDAPRLMR